MSKPITCRSCGLEFDVPRKRGRPPVVCDDCRETPQPKEEKVSTKDRVDRLEMLLKSQGKHITQQKDW